mmetsp:Transcript_22396/g.35934  ORF Transcript_22396/g.35934 Transcript_22396/m.35934 type:complete len:200 (-) Transcript_22396:139-738(-)
MFHDLFKVWRALLVNDVHIKRQIEAQRIIILRLQWFSVCAMRLIIAILSRHKHNHVNRQQPTRNNMIVLSTREIPMNTAFVALATNPVPPWIFRIVLRGLITASSQELVISAAKMRRPILAITATEKALKIHKRVRHIALADLVMLIQRVVFLKVIAAVTDCKLVILDRLNMREIELRFHRHWRRKRYLLRTCLKASFL